VKNHAAQGFEPKTKLTHTTKVLEQNPRDISSRFMMASSNHLVSLGVNNYYGFTVFCCN